MSDAATKEAWTLVDMLIENRDQNDILVNGKGYYESCAWHIARAIREAVEAERAACAAALREACGHCNGTGREEYDSEIWCPYCGWQVDTIEARGKA